MTRGAHRGLPWFVFGAANMGVILLLSLASWYLLTDTRISPFKTYPQPFNAVLFWSILVTVFLGFNLQLHGFTRYPQPLRGVVLVVLTVALAIGIVVVLTRAWGSLDPSFAYSRPGNAGYLLAALPVLIGFFTYVTVAINWNLWPWPALGLKQPWVGIGAILLMTPLTVLGFALLALPGLAVWAKPGNVILEVPTAIGWFYSVIIAAIMTGLAWENWPWRAAKSGGRIALASLVGNLVLGTGLYFMLLGVLHLLIDGATITKMGIGFNVYAAELGVCWNFWLIAWANVFENRPLGGSPAMKYLTRAAITFVLGVATFLVYYYFLAENVLHEPVAAGSLHGDALGWVDFMVLWTLFYVVYLGSFGLRRRES